MVARRRRAHETRRAERCPCVITGRRQMMPMTLYCSVGHASDHHFALSVVTRRYDGADQRRPHQLLVSRAQSSTSSANESGEAMAIMAASSRKRQLGTGGRCGIGRLMRPADERRCLLQRISGLRRALRPSR